MKDNYTKLAEYVRDILEEIRLYENHVSTYLCKKFEELNRELLPCTMAEKDIICKKIIEGIGEEKLYALVYAYTFAAEVTQNPEYMERMLNMLLETNCLSPNSLYYCYYQIKCEMFYFPNLNTEKNQFLKWKLLERILESFMQEYGIFLNKIPEHDRNPDIAVVICEQILGLDHGPTSTTLDRCYTLINSMKKNVVLINTIEILSEKGEVPVWRSRVANFDPNGFSRDKIKYRGCVIPYVQCGARMPDMNICCALLNMIMEIKPSIVVSVGGSSIVAGLVNQLVPAVCIGLTQCEVESSLSDYQIVPESIDSIGENLLQRMGKEESYVIKGRFGFQLREQQEILKRSDLGLKEDDFVLAIVGWRLDFEMDDAFLQMLGKIHNDHVKVVVIGRWEKYQQIVEGYPWVEGCINYLGKCGDVLARLEMCDLYVNPKRRGGGTSCVEALYKGVPVVTLDYGDVAGIAGKEFVCGSYDEMEGLINRYMTDKGFYIEKSNRAREVAKLYMDSGKEFERCINVYLEREKDRERKG